MHPEESKDAGDALRTLFPVWLQVLFVVMGAASCSVVFATDWLQLTAITESPTRLAEKIDSFIVLWTNAAIYIVAVEMGVLGLISAFTLFLDALDVVEHDEEKY